MSAFLEGLTKKLRRSLFGVSPQDLLEDQVEGAQKQLEEFRGLVEQSRSVIQDLEVVLARRLDSLQEPEAKDLGKDVELSQDAGGVEVNERQSVLARLDVEELRSELLKQSSLLEVLVSHMAAYETALSKAERVLEETVPEPSSSEA